MNTRYKGIVDCKIEMITVLDDADIQYAFGSRFADLMRLLKALAGDRGIEIKWTATPPAEIIEIEKEQKRTTAWEQMRGSGYV